MYWQYYCITMQVYNTGHIYIVILYVFIFFCFVNIFKIYYLSKNLNNFVLVYVNNYPCNIYQIAVF